MAKERNTVCRCCVCIFTSVGFMFLTLWLTSLRAHPPKCYVQSLYFPTLNKTFHDNHNHTNNNTIFFTLKLANANSNEGVQYDAVRVSFGVFVSDNATVPLANGTLEGFYQGHGKTAVKSGSAESHGGVNQTAAEGGGGRVFLRVEVATAVKYKTMVWYTKRHRLWGGANVEVNVSSGVKMSPKGIRFGNVPARFGSGAAAATARGVGILLCLLLSLCVYLS